jgi:1-phosphofructokinase family hexose kinase
VIVFVAGHPSVDRLYEVGVVQPGVIHRPDLVRVVPGGKGLNAARAARLLGGDPHVLAILAGHAGHWIAQALRAEGVDATFVWTSGETRTSVSVASTGEPGDLITGFYEPSESIPEAAWYELEEAARELIPRADVVCLSGGLIAGAPEDGYRRMAEVAHAGGVPVAVDSHGPPLLATFEAGPELIKLNADEAAETLDVAVPTRDLLRWAAGAATEIHRRVPGNRITVVTCASSGMALADGSGEALGGHIDEVGSYPVGSGDAVLASLALGLRRAIPAPEMLALALAAGAANAEVPGSGVLDPVRVPELAARASIAPIAP